MKDYLVYGKPEDKGISCKSILGFIDELEDMNINMHSIIIIRDNTIVTEAYYKPYEQDTLHRMFSITKSFTSIAIGILADEGKINLDDKICSYFQDKTEGIDVHPYIKEITIRDMLTMSTAHDSTTYKKVSDNDYVKSFFTVKPSHKPGTSFAYDTSSSHTLAGLILKITGKNVIEFLYEKCLGEIGFSKEAYGINDPMGITLGGSGLMAKPMDVARFAYLLLNEGNINGKQYISKEYIKAATTKQKDTSVRGNVSAEKLGYGYKFFMTKYNGFCCYGMGGQLALVFPEKKLILVTTADTQDVQNGTQFIFDSFYRNIYEKLDILSEDISYDRLKSRIENLEIKPVKPVKESRILNKINNKTIVLDDNQTGLKKVFVSLEDAKNKVILTYSDKVFEIDFETDHLKQTVFPHYNMNCMVQGCAVDDNTFIIRCHMTDESVCPLYIEITTDCGSGATVFMKHKDETLFKEFQGYASGNIL